jgi:hypothetical protein
MKKLIYILVAVMVVLRAASCSKKEEGRQKWEYKTLVASGLDLGLFSSRPDNIPHAALDTLGMAGWELVDVYTRTETVHPNFGDSKYVTGLQPNSRTAEVYYVFKRPVVANDTVKYEPVEYVSFNLDEVVETTDSVPD